MGLKFRIRALGAGWGVVLMLMSAATANAIPPKETGFEKIPDGLIAVSSEKPHEYAIIVEKSTQSLYLYAFGGTNRLILRMPCSTGEVDGPKNRSGDKKTPEGIYFFTREHPERDLSAIYGSRAFPMDYPNLMDQIAGRDGNAIWMHGTNKPLAPRDTNGCVALENRDIDKLAGYITLNRTPIIIVEKLSTIPLQRSNELKKSVYDLLAQWQAALGQGTYHQYLRFYDESYLPDISWWPAWLKIKNEQGTSARAFFTVEIKNVMILNHNDDYVALFDQFLKTADAEVFAGTRKLFLTARGNQVKIVGDDYQVIPQVFAKKTDSSHPLIAAGLAIGKTATVKVAAGPKARPQAAKASGDSREIQAMVKDWLNAWSSKDITAYGGFYSKNFKSEGGAGLQSWLNYKNRLNHKYDYIKVTQQNLVVREQENRATATFVQHYDSSSLKTVGTKQLVLVRENGQWKIIREIWKKR